MKHILLAAAVLLTAPVFAQDVDLDKLLEQETKKEEKKGQKWCWQQLKPPVFPTVTV